MQVKRDETWLAIAAGVLARVLCRHCTTCGKRDSRRQNPIQCPSVKRFIAELRDKSAANSILTKYSST